jgi:tetratricopeptide (TPR) repeat protein
LAAYDAGEQKEGEVHLQRAKIRGTDSGKREALHLAAKRAKRYKKYEEFLKRLKEILELFPDDAYAHLALAKYYEHVSKNFKEALKHAENTGPAEGEAACRHRLFRLKRKIKSEENLS